MSYTSSAYNETDPTGTTYSRVMNMRDMSLLSLHVENSGLTGALTLFASNRPNVKGNDEFNSDHWVEVTDVTFSALAGAGNQLINIGNAASLNYIVRYVHTSGTGRLQIISTAGRA